MNNHAAEIYNAQKTKEHISAGTQPAEPAQFDLMDNEWTTTEMIICSVVVILIAYALFQIVRGRK